MAAMDKDWKKIQQDHVCLISCFSKPLTDRYSLQPEWNVGDAEFEKTEREASARISRRP